MPLSSLGLVLIVGLLAVLSVVAVVSGRIGLPYTVSLVVVGLAVSAISPPVESGLAPELVLPILLPGLVFEGALRLDGAELRRTMGGTALLAVPGVLLTAAVTAVILSAATHLSLAEAFVIGTIVSATDPVAVVRTMRRLNAPSRLVTLVDAESLFNDGTAALATSIALAALGGATPSLAGGAVQFVVGLATSIAIGLVVGALVSRALHASTDPVVELTLTLLAAYGSYLVADLLGQSGIIASVVAGIVLGTDAFRTGLSRQGRATVDAVWDSLAFILTGAAFLLIGLAIPLSSLATAAVTILWGVAAVLVGRAIVVYGLLGTVSALAWRHDPVRRLPMPWLHVLNWTGLRGAVAIALALSIPLSEPNRDLLQGTIFGIVLFTLLVQGTTAGRVVRRVGIHPRRDGRTGKASEEPEG